jgi:hypothetical protein
MSELTPIRQAHPNERGNMPILKPAARAKRAEKIRFVAAKAGSHIATQKDNGDEVLYPEKCGS